MSELKKPDFNIKNHVLTLGSTHINMPLSLEFEDLSIREQAKMWQIMQWQQQRIEQLEQNENKIKAEAVREVSEAYSAYDGGCGRVTDFLDEYADKLESGDE